MCWFQNSTRSPGDCPGVQAQSCSQKASLHFLLKFRMFFFSPCVHLVVFVVLEACLDVLEVPFS